MNLSFDNQLMLAMTCSEMIVVLRGKLDIDRVSNSLREVIMSKQNLLGIVK